MAILGEIKKEDLDGMSPSVPEGARKLLKDIGVMKAKKMVDLFPKEAGYSKVSYLNQDRNEECCRPDLFNDPMESKEVNKRRKGFRASFLR